jgi:hypothetical protein
MTTALVAGACIALPVGLAMLVSAPPAHADDSVYLMSLAQDGITCSQLQASNCNDTLMVVMGHEMCRDLENGNGFIQEVRNLTPASHGHVSDLQMAYWVGTAIAIYCPDQRYKIRNGS